MLQVTKDFDYETQCLIREMERVKSEIAILDKQKADLVSNQKEFDRLYEENEELKKSNSDLEGKNTVLTNSINSKTILNDSLIKKSEGLTLEIDEKSKIVDKANADIILTKNASENLQAILREIVNVKKEQEKVDKILNDNNSMVVELKNKIKSLEQEIVKNEGIVSGLISKIESKNSELSGLDKQIKDKELYKNAVLSDTERYQQAIKTLDLNILDLNKSIESKKLDLENLNKEIANCEIVFKKQREEMSAISHIIESQEEEKKKMTFYKERLDAYAKKMKLDVTF